MGRAVQHWGLAVEHRVVVNLKGVEHIRITWGTFFFTDV